MKHGAVLDRILRPDWLDVALGLALAARPLAESHHLLDEALRSVLPGPTARSKTRTALAHVWLKPPTGAAALIRWALVHGGALQDRRVLHLGALFATYPFFAEVCGHIGRVIGAQDVVATPDVRRRMRRSWGDNSTVNVATRRAVATLRGFGFLDGRPGASLSRAGTRLPVSNLLSGWLVHALLVARGSSAIYLPEITGAPELFMLCAPSTIDRNYALLEQFTEAGGTVVLQPRRSVAVPALGGSSSPLQPARHVRQPHVVAP